MATEVNDSNFDQEVIQSKEPVLVDLWAPWCGPCKMLTPIIDKLAEEYKGKVKIVKLNTDDNSNTAVQFQVQAIPTLLLFKSGKLVDRLTGVQPEREIKNKLEDLLK